MIDHNRFLLEQWFVASHKTAPYFPRETALEALHEKTACFDSS